MIAVAIESVRAVRWLLKVVVEWLTITGLLMRAIGLLIRVIGLLIRVIVLSMRVIVFLLRASWFLMRVTQLLTRVIVSLMRVVPLPLPTTHSSLIVSSLSPQLTHSSLPTV